MSPSLHTQAERLCEVFAELVRRYKFRDRDEVCCHGVSVSQCYALESLDTHGPMSMGELAEQLCLEISTVTRVVDHLVREGLAKRARCAEDRRVCRAKVTPRGRSLVRKIRGELVEEYERVLRRVPKESREAVITAMSHLLSAFTQRQRGAGGRKETQEGELGTRIAKTVQVKE